MLAFSKNIKIKDVMSYKIIKNVFIVKVGIIMLKENVY